MKEIVFKLPQPEPDTCPCPYCHGSGNMGDGSFMISPEEVRIRPSTPCSFCGGKGRVRVTYERLA